MNLKQIVNRLLCRKKRVIVSYTNVEHFHALHGIDMSDSALRDAEIERKRRDFNESANFDPVPNVEPEHKVNV